MHKLLPWWMLVVVLGKGSQREMMTVTSILRSFKTEKSLTGKRLTTDRKAVDVVAHTFEGSSYTDALLMLLRVCVVVKEK